MINGISYTHLDDCSSLWTRQVFFQRSSLPNAKCKIDTAQEYIQKQYYDVGCVRLCKCILTAPTFFRAAVIDIAGVEGLDAGRAGALAAGSSWEGLGCGRGLSEVDDTATTAAAAADGARLPAAEPTFTPRAASFHNTQYPGLDYT